MKLILERKTRIRLEMAGEDFEIVSEGASLSPYHLLAASLASCSALTVASWAEGAAIDTTPLTISVGWEMAESRPKRVTHMDMELRWPGLPEDRVATAERVADLCPVHATLKRGTEISRRIIA